MEARAIARYIRISPRKARLVANMIKNKDVYEALNILKFTPKKAARIIKKVLNSALANADHNHNMDVDNLYVKNVLVDQGPVLKRIKPRAQGRAYGIKHRYSHITVILDERKGR